MMVTIVLSLGCLLAYTAVFGFSIMLIICLLPAVRSRSWPSVPAVVRSSRVVSNRACNGLPGHHPYVGYVYSVGDVEYSAASISAGLHVFRYLSRRASERIVAEFPVGATVPVFYDPTFPELSVLRPGISLGLLYPLVLFMAAVTAASALSLIVFQRLVP